MATRIGVMYLGRIVEMAPAAELFAAPAPSLHAPADRRAARPRHERAAAPGRSQGEIPNPIAPPPGCAFHPRCPHAFEPCPVDVPALVGAWASMRRPAMPWRRAGFRTASGGYGCLAAGLMTYLGSGERQGWRREHEAGDSRRVFRPSHQYSAGCHQACRDAGIQLGVDLGGLRLGRRDTGRVDPGEHQEDQGRHRHHADAGANAGDGRHDRHDPRPAFRQPLHRRRRRLRPAGRGRLAWRRLRQARDAAQGIRRDHAPGVRARAGAELRGQGVPDPLSRARQHRARQAAQEHPAL